MNKLTLFLLLTIPSLIFSQSYSLDKAEIYTANNEVEETLNTANNILCIISKIKAEQFIDKGPYKAQVFDSRCDVAGARADARRSSKYYIISILCFFNHVVYSHKISTIASKSCSSTQ